MLLKDNTFFMTTGYNLTKLWKILIERPPPPPRGRKIVYIVKIFACVSAKKQT